MLYVQITLIDGRVFDFNASPAVAKRLEHVCNDGYFDPQADYFYPPEMIASIEIVDSAAVTAEAAGWEWN